MKSSTLYFHYPCFDGLVSGVLAWEFLEKHKNWNIREFCPVDYKMRDTWLASDLKMPCAIVDFLYHPRAEFWADHHQTSILNKKAETDFQRRRDKACLLFDDRARSCASLLFRHLGAFLSDKPHFKEMISWAAKIDSATYSTVEEAILGDAPALQINRTLSLKDESGSEYALFLLRELQTHNLSYVASLDEVKRREEQARRSILNGLKRVKARLRIEPGDVAVFDASQNEDQMISRYAPYYFAPKARYSITVVRSSDDIRITAMRNPWRKFRSIPLGRSFAKFGGGGHQRVGAVRLPVDQRKCVHDVVKSLLSQMSGVARK
jgi:hypothetical protein